MSSRVEKSHMDETEVELLKAIHQVEKKVIGLETKIDDSVTGRFKDVDRRQNEHQELLKKHSADIEELKSQPHRAKSKWFDEVAKYIVIALLSYMLFKSGIK